MSKGAIVIEGHVQGLSNTRALGRAGIPVFVLNHGERCVARYSKYCYRFFSCPPYDTDGLAHFLIALAEQYSLQGWVVFPSNDLAVLTLSRNRKKLASLYHLMAPDPEVAMQVCDKFILMQKAAAAGLPVPFTWNLSVPVPGHVHWPVLIKGRVGLPFYRKTGKKVVVCDNPEEYRYQQEKFSASDWGGLVMVQELIPEEKNQYTISVAVFSKEGAVQTSWVGIKVRQHPSRFGTATLARSIHDKEAVNYAERICKALHYNGICEIELIRDPRDGRLKLIEINPRTWLWVELARASGVDLTLIAWQDANDLPPVFPEHYRENLVWRNFYTDVWFGLGSLIRRKLGLKSYFRQMKGEKVPAVWAKDDPRPFLRLTLILPYLMRSR